MPNAPKPPVPSRVLEDAMADALAAVERVEKQRSGEEAESKPAASPAPPPGSAGQESAPVTIEVEVPPAGPTEPATAEEEAPQGGGAKVAQAGKGSATEAELRDQLIRLAADFDNYRKRATRQMEETRKFGSEAVLATLLPVIDNFDRALAHAKEDSSPLIQGVRMVAKQLIDVAAQHGVKGFQSLGQVFDPERHEAVGQAPTSDHPPGSILEEVVKGYMIHDRLLRAAQVVVAAAPAAATGEGQKTDGGKTGGGGAPSL
jgi:molecular chaperone GrpE